MRRFAVHADLRKASRRLVDIYLHDLPVRPNAHAYLDLETPVIRVFLAITLGIASRLCSKGTFICSDFSLLTAASCGKSFQVFRKIE